MWRAILYILGVFLVGFSLLRFCYSHTHGFALQKVLSRLTPSPQFENPSLTVQEQEDLKKLLDQPFYYLGKGAQAYVFHSEDGQIVLKLCRFDHLRPPFWFTRFHFPFCGEKERIARLLHKRGRLEQEFGSYQIAFQKLKEQTGLLYIHLNKSDNWHQKIVLYDNIKIKHTLDLDQLEFVVQKRATPFFATLEHLMQDNEGSALQEALASVRALVEKRCREGIFDKDPDLVTNFGFIGTQAIQIDTGRFSFLERAPSDEEIACEVARVCSPLEQFLQEKL